MSNIELLLQEIKGLPPDYTDELLDFVAYLKHKARPVESTAVKHETFAKTVEEIRALCKDFAVSVDSFLEERHAEMEHEEAAHSRSFLGFGLSVLYDHPTLSFPIFVLQAQHLTYF